MISSRQHHAIRLFLQGMYTDAEIAELVGVDAVTIGRWKKDPEFVKELKDKYEVLQAIDINWRIERNRQLLAPIYKEVSDRIEKGELGQMKLKDLIEVLQRVTREMRDDDKIAKLKGEEDKPKKTGEEDEFEGDDISSRYNKSALKGVIKEDRAEAEQGVRKMINLFRPSDEKLLENSDAQPVDESEIN